MPIKSMPIQSINDPMVSFAFRYRNENRIPFERNIAIIKNGNFQGVASSKGYFLHSEIILMMRVVAHSKPAERRKVDIIIKQIDLETKRLKNTFSKLPQRNAGDAKDDNYKNAENQYLESNMPEKFRNERERILKQFPKNSSTDIFSERNPCSNCAEDLESYGGKNVSVTYAVHMKGKTRDQVAQALKDLYDQYRLQLQQQSSAQQPANAAAAGSPQSDSKKDTKLETTQQQVAPKSESSRYNTTRRQRLLLKRAKKQAVTDAARIAFGDLPASAAASTAASAATTTSAVSESPRPPPDRGAMSAVASTPAVASDSSSLAASDSTVEQKTNVGKKEMLLTDNKDAAPTLTPPPPPRGQGAMPAATNTVASANAASGSSSSTTPSADKNAIITINPNKSK